jgi:SAM-dependent methyltransferase
VECPFEEGVPTVLLADTSNPDEEWQRKRWPHFPELARRLRERGFQVGLIGGPTEAEAFGRADWPDGVVNLLGKHAIAETTYLIQKAGLLIANDSGPAHMAAAVGAETYVLFGPTLEAKNLPAGPRVHLLASEVGCRPCQYLPSWQDCTRRVCMEGISVERVLEAVLAADRPTASRAEGEQGERAPVAADVGGQLRIDLGCGRYKRNGFVGVDLDPDSAADTVCDVTEGLPFETDSVDYVAADNLLEHIGERFSDVMNEIWRVCKPGGTVEITVPLFPSQKAVSDPTHRRYFTEETFAYFDCRSSRWQSFGSSYGFKPFLILKRNKLAGELEVIMTPHKAPARRTAAPPADGPKPRVWFLSHNQPGAGGGENAMHHVANGLARAGYDVTVSFNSQPFIHDLPVEPPADAAYEVRWIEGPEIEAFHRASARALAELSDRVDVCLPLWRAASTGLMQACREHHRFGDPLRAALAEATLRSEPGRVRHPERLRRDLLLPLQGTRPELREPLRLLREACRPAEGADDPVRGPGQVEGAQDQLLAGRHRRRPRRRRHAFADRLAGAGRARPPAGLAQSCGAGPDARGVSPVHPALELRGLQPGRHRGDGRRAAPDNDSGRGHPLDHHP